MTYLNSHFLIIFQFSNFSYLGLVHAYPDTYIFFLMEIFFLSFRKNTCPHAIACLTEHVQYDIRTSSYSNSFLLKTINWRFKKIHSGDRFRKSLFCWRKKSPFSKILPLRSSMSTSPGVGKSFGSIINNSQR